MLGTAQRILGDRDAAVLRDGSIGWEYAYRVAKCHRDTRGAAPSVYRSPDKSRAEYRDVYTCGSVWHCPVCAGKVTARRRDELGAALGVWTAAGGDVWLLTFTHAHEKDARALSAQLDLERKAYRWVSSTRAWKAIMAEAFCGGTIRALEVTHGEWHGWHPHRHMLTFTAPGQGATLDRLRKLWVRALLRVGLVELPAPGPARIRKLRHLLAYALDIRPGRYAAEYVAKFGLEPETAGGRWGIGSELTRGHTKASGEERGRTPFGLLHRAAQGDKRAAMLFRDFGLAFHGARQLYWTNGFRARLIELARDLRSPDLFSTRRWIALLARDRDDAIIAADPDRRCTERVIRLDPSQWRTVLSRRGRGIVLEVARWASADQVRWLIDDMATGPPIDSPVYGDEWAPTVRAA